MGAKQQSGASLVELLVGLVVGLLVIAGATALFANHINNSRRLNLEARVNQDLRTAADTISRDLRRGGYWENSIAGTVIAAASAATAPNPNSSITYNTATSIISYSLARDSSAGRTSNDNNLNTDEQFGFRLNAGAVEMQLGSGNWQQLTNPQHVTVTFFKITPSETAVDIRDSCTKKCCDAIVTGVCTSINQALCPKVTVRQYALLLSGQSVRDAAVKRTLEQKVRVRNDLISGACPP